MEKKILAVIMIIFSVVCSFSEINLGEVSSWEEGFSIFSVGNTFFKQDNRILFKKKEE